MDLRSNVAPTPSLSEQTPGLDPRRRLMRPRSILGLLGGLLVVGVGAFLAWRRRAA